MNLLHAITGQNPDYFELLIDEESAFALCKELGDGVKITLSNLRRSREDRHKLLHVAYLLLKRGDDIYLMPESQMELQLGDQLLIVSDDESRVDFEYIINNINELAYVLGKEQKRYSFFKKNKI